MFSPISEGFPIAEINIDLQKISTDSQDEKIRDAPNRFIWHYRLDIPIDWAFTLCTHTAQGKIGHHLTQLLPEGISISECQ